MSRRRTDEQGFVMVTVIVVMAFALMLAGVAVASSLQSREGSKKDLRAKRAQQAADAGISAAIYRLNQLKLGNVNFSGGITALSQGIACQTLLTLNLNVSIGFTDAGAASGACGAGKGPVPQGVPFFDEDTGDGTHATVYATLGASAPSTTTPMLAPVRAVPVLVSVGRDRNGTPDDTTDDTIRRVRVRLNPVSPFKAIEASGNLTFDTPGLLATTTTLNGAAVANGDLTFKSPGLLNTFVNTDVSLSPLALTGSVTYDGAKTTSGLVNVNVGTLNSANEPPVDRKAVTISPAKPDCPSSGCPTTGYTAAKRTLVATSGTVNLPGGDYVFCKVSITGSATLRPQPTNGLPVRIFLDSPSSARCAANAMDTDNGNITITGRIDPGVTVQPSQLQIYTAGPAKSPRAKATFDTTNAALSLIPGFFYYGPTTNVTLKYSTFQGSIIGNDVTLTAAGVAGLVGVGTFTQDLGVNNLPLSSSVGTFSSDEYAECSATDVNSTGSNSQDNC